METTRIRMQRAIGDTTIATTTESSSSEKEGNDFITAGTICAMILSLFITVFVAYRCVKAKRGCCKYSRVARKFARKIE